MPSFRVAGINFNQNHRKIVFQSKKLGVCNFLLKSCVRNCVKICYLHKHFPLHLRDIYFIYIKISCIFDYLCFFQCALHVTWEAPLPSGSTLDCQTPGHVIEPCSIHASVSGVHFTFHSLCWGLPYLVYPHLVQKTPKPIFSFNLIWFYMSMG